LAGGQVDLFFADPFAAAGFIAGGQIKVLAVTDTARLASLPHVPTMAEAGFKNVTLVSGAAMFAPAKTDPAAVERLGQDLRTILAKREAQEFIQKMGASPMPMTGAELRSFVGAEIARWGKLVALAGIPKK
jgi:tripartite-type tricarboxylate transporter receptor subunit TctC